jgi:hypothetical protein
MYTLTHVFRFLLGSGWWRLWYCFFYFIAIAGNFAWFGELYDWCWKGESGPAAEAVFIGLITLGAIPLLFFSVFHLILAFWRGTDSVRYMTGFGLIFISSIIIWMIICPLCVASAFFSGFVAYYVLFTVFFMVNLFLLWISSQRTSIRLFMTSFS